MRILALDLAATTGWATSCGQFGHRTFDWEKVHHGARWLQFEEWLVDLLTVLTPDAIAIEQPIHRGKAATRQLKSLIAVAELVAERFKLPSETVNISTIKKHATGNGNATKAEMIAAARDAGVAETVGHDEVDALWLCHYAIAENLFQ